MSIDTNKEVIRRWVEACNSQQLDVFNDLFTPNTIDNVGKKTGIEWWKQIFRMLYATFPDWSWTLEDLIAEGDKVVARLTMKGTHQGSELPFLQGLEPTGKIVTWTHHHTFRFVEGRIAEHWANRDDLGVLRQIEKL